MNGLRFQWMRVGATLAGLGALVWLIWGAGPALRIGDAYPLELAWPRWIAIGVCIAFATATLLWNALRVRRRDAALIDGISAGQREAKVLDTRFTEALAALKRQGRMRGFLSRTGSRRALYELPWYVIIGAPGAGKTTALLNAGLEFPLAARFGPGALRGVGGTRNCDWWFTSEAVLIDTAGRYTTHESDRIADSTAWAAFLELLARHRPQRPINGVLLALSTNDLLAANPAERALHAATLRARMAEIHATLKTRVPVYVLITKVDLLAGFAEFFGDFDKDERAQVWGVTFPHIEHTTTAGLLATLPTELSLLGTKLDRVLVNRLGRERDLDRRAALYRLPQEWHGLKELLPPLLQQIFPVSDGLNSWLRGVYFTSGTQEGTPIDRALGELGRSLGLAHRIMPPARSSGRSFFLTHLLRSVVFAEAELAGVNRRWQQRRAILQWGMLGAALALVVLGAGVLLASSAGSQAELTRWTRLLETADGTVAGARASSPTDLMALLPLLQSVHELIESKHPTRWSIGLDRTADLGSAADDTYYSLLRGALLPRTAASLEQRMRGAPTENPAMLYEALKAYVMLYGGRNFDRDALRAYLIADWQTTLPQEVTAEQRRALTIHLDRLLATGEVGATSAADSALLDEVRNRVGATSLPVLIYNRLAHLGSRDSVPAFQLAQAAGPGASGVLESASGSAAVPGAFTLAGYRSIVGARARALVSQFAAERAWVLGEKNDAIPLDAAALSSAVEKLYLADHGAAWSAFLGEIRLARANSLSASAQLAGTLARPDSPLAALLAAIGRELALGESTTGPIAAPLQALRQYATARPGPLDELLAALSTLAARLAAFDDAAKRGVATGAAPDLAELNAQAQRAPAPVQALVRQFNADTALQLVALQREAITQHVRREVLPLCTQAVTSRYPLSRAGKEELSRQEFVRMFGANGVLDGAFRRHLAPWVDTGSQPWTYRGTDGARGDSTDSLRQFQRARIIRDAFFRDEGKVLGAALQFRVLQLDPGITRFDLTVDGQSLQFTTGARTPVALLWPGPDADAGVRVHVSAAASAPSTFSFSGPWGLLRLLDRARVEVVDATRMIATFDVEGRRARFEIASRGTANPIHLAALEQFECPQRR